MDDDATASDTSTASTPLHVLCEAETLLCWLQELVSRGRFGESELMPGRLLLSDLLDTISGVPLLAWNMFHAGEIQPHVELERLTIAADQLLDGLEEQPAHIAPDDIIAVATASDRIRTLIRDSDDRMTAKQIASLIWLPTGKWCPVGTLRNSQVLQQFIAQASRGGRPTTYHYVVARPALEKRFKASLPDLLDARRLFQTDNSVAP